MLTFLWLFSQFKRANTSVTLSLESNMEYKIWVKAYTLKNEGESSDYTINKTDISGPSSPQILNLTCQTQDTIFVQWARPAEFYNDIEYYYIYLYGDFTFDNITISGSKEHLETSVSARRLLLWNKLL